MINNVTLVGRLTKDVQVNKTSNGTSVTNFTLAVQDGYDRERAHFIRCVAWGAQADFMANYLSKGALIGIVGEIQTDSYEDNDGKMVYTTEVNARTVQALESKAQREANSVSRPQQKRYQAPDDWAKPKNEKEPVLNMTSDDLPF